MPAGRPLKFKDPIELQTKIDAYFADCEPHPIQVVRYEWAEIEEEYIDSKGDAKTRTVTDNSVRPSEIVEWAMSERKPYMITGLANFLGTSRETLVNYEEREEFFDTIKDAKSKVEQDWERLLIGANATGPIFNLKNNYAWRDRTEVEESGEKKIVIETRVHDDDIDTTDDVKLDE